MFTKERTNRKVVYLSGLTEKQFEMLALFVSLEGVLVVTIKGGLVWKTVLDAPKLYSEVGKKLEKLNFANSHHPFIPGEG